MDDTPALLAANAAAVFLAASTFSPTTTIAATTISDTTETMIRRLFLLMFPPLGACARIY
jgi:hypothetical protein